MTTLLIYDNMGCVYLQVRGSYRIPQGEIQYIEIEIPEGKILKSIDTTTTQHIPLYEDLPISESDILKQQLTETQNILTEFVDMKYNMLLTT